MAGKGQLSATNIKPVYHIQLLLTLLLSQLFNYVFKSYHSKYHRKKHMLWYIYKHTCKLYPKKREKRKTKQKNKKKQKKTRNCLYVYVVNRRQRRKNRIVKKLMIGDDRRKSIVEIWRWNQTRNDSWEIYKYLQIDEKTQVKKINLDK